MKQSIRMWMLLPLLAASLSCNGQEYVSNRPAKEQRLFVSEVVDAKIDETTTQLKNKKLAWMFANCMPNTLDTTIHPNGEGDTFVPHPMSVEIYENLKDDEKSSLNSFKDAEHGISFMHETQRYCDLVRSFAISIGAIDEHTEKINAERLFE